LIFYFIILAYIPLVCFNQFQKPRKKLDGAISLSFNLDEVTSFGQIEEEILSKEFSKTWEKIEIGFYSYQLSRGIGADQFNLKSKKSVFAFVGEAKCKKGIQLCVYQEKIIKRKTIVYGSSVIDVDDSISKTISSKNMHVGFIIFIILYKI